MNNKIQPYHKEKLAYVYLRQSTMGQVCLNRESTERQYALKDRAESLGWRQYQIKVLDNDLGQSGVHANNREDFKTLVADVFMGKVGAVFALEASRLSRSCTDWHRLLEICALTNTLILDEDGYNPKDFNDQLLLGLKGTMSQAELHFIRARLLGGKINKAKKGELRFPLPVGYSHDDYGRTVLDADEQVREVVALLFKIFKEKGSAYAVAHHFANIKLKFPKRAYGGVWKGKLIWGQLTLSRVLGVLKNPAHAGTYVYGRYHYDKSLSPQGELRVKMLKLPQDDWQVTIQEHHEGYITWDDYLENQKRLEQNQTNGMESLLPEPVREGLALLHGLLVCSYCGHKITVRYQGNGGIQPYYQCSWKRKEGGAGTKDCLSIRCEPIDHDITQRILSVIEPK
ncbi:MAG: recombinase family protein [Gammaproteobacteria bacterium]|nr:recombinase family protein [Gammaproteobacteria bacterium]